MELCSCRFVEWQNGGVVEFSKILEFSKSRMVEWWSCGIFQIVESLNVIWWSCRIVDSSNGGVVEMPNRRIVE